MLPFSKFSYSSSQFCSSDRSLQSGYWLQTLYPAMQMPSDSHWNSLDLHLFGKVKRPSWLFNDFKIGGFCEVFSSKCWTSGDIFGVCSKGVWDGDEGYLQYNNEWNYTTFNIWFFLHEMKEMNIIHNDTWMNEWAHDGWDILYITYHTKIRHFHHRNHSFHRIWIRC